MDRQKEEPLLLSLGFTRIFMDGIKYTLPVQVWKSFGESKRRLRVEWHEALQKRLDQKLKKSLAKIREPLHLTWTQRMFLVQKFARDHGDDAGSVPLIRGLVGCLQTQLYKRKLVDWKVDEYVMTQNGEKPMMDYNRLIRGVLGMELVYQKEGSQDDDKDRTPIITAAAANGDHYMVWRMNPTLKDRDLAAILQCFPKQQINQAFPLSSICRPKSVVLSSKFSQRWLSAIFDGFIHFARSIILPITL